MKNSTRTSREFRRVISFVIAVVILTAAGMAASASTVDDDSTTRRMMVNASFSAVEYQKLAELMFEGYEDMSISEYRQKTWLLIDTPEYRDLLERFSQSESFYERKDGDSKASFLFYVLDPLTAEKWKSRSFGNVAVTAFPELHDQAMLEYVFTITIINAEQVSVREYENARLGIVSAFQAFIESKGKDELKNSALMKEAIDEEIAIIKQQYDTDALHIDIEFSFKPLENAGDDSTVDMKLPDDEETRRVDYGTEEDYTSLLALMTSDYASKTVSEFNMELLEWANENFDRLERISADVDWNDNHVNLSDEEQFFVRVTVYLSGTENGRFVQSNYTGNPEKDPVYNECLPQKLFTDENRRPAWCDLFYQFSYHIMDRDMITIGERDRCIDGMIRAIHDFWSETPLDELVLMTKDEVVARLVSMAEEFSTDGIIISIDTNRVHFENMDERSKM